MEIPAYILTVPIVLFMLIFLLMRRNKRRTVNYPPGSCGWPFLGETLDFLRANKEGKPEEFVKERIEKYKSKIFKTSLMGETVVVLGGASGNKFLFSNENKQVNILWPISVRKIIGPCLITTVGEEAKIMRKMLSTFVSPDAFSRLYIKTMELVAHHHFMNYWQEHIEIASSKKEGEFLNWDDIQKMKYSWNVVSEVMRLTPPIMGAYREAIVDINYEGYHIPKGWKFYWNTGLTSLDPEIFPNATSLEPSRFEGAGPAPYTYIPFGGGPRMCVGKEFARLEILIFLYILIRKFNWKLLLPNEKMIYDPMPTPLEGLPISLQPHNY